MSIDKLTYVSCDVCDGWPTEPIPGTAADARRQARHEGYVRRDGQDVCPECQRAALASRETDQPKEA